MDLGGVGEPRDPARGGLMIGHEPFPASVLRAPSPTAACSCEHWIHCDHACHGRHCDPTENTCDLAFVPDEGGLTHWGCDECTPGRGAPHYLGCDLLGWSVPARRSAGD